MFLFSCATKQINTDSEVIAWKNMHLKMDSIVAPTFDNKTFEITNFGAQRGGVIDNTEAFKKAIKACSENGGGIVLVPQGKFLTGPIHLESNINLQLDENAEITFSTNPSDYPIVHTSFEGTEVMNYSPLIYAYQKTNVAVTGKGTLNGQANNQN